MRKQLALKDYINQRHPRWMDYAEYHASLADTPDEGENILNTVLEAILKKNPEKLQELLDSKMGEYTGLDFFVLRMIKLYAHSNTLSEPLIEREDRITLTREELEHLAETVVMKTLAATGVKGTPIQSGRIYRKQMIEILGRVRYDEAVREGWLKVNKHNPLKQSSRVYTTTENWDRFLKLHTNQRV